MNDTDKFSGGCLCGQIRYELTGTPARISSCHCRMCQRQSGAAHVPAAEYPTGQVTWEKEPAMYKSSAWASRSFCSNCGSSIGFHTEEETVWISVGTLDTPEKFKPQFHIFTESKMPWTTIDEALPRYEDGGPI